MSRGATHQFNVLLFAENKNKRYLKVHTQIYIYIKIIVFIYTREIKETVIFNLRLSSASNSMLLAVGICRNTFICVSVLYYIDNSNNFSTNNMMILVIDT